MNQAHKPLAKHVGIILDGNRRWAKAHDLPSCEGHKAGAKIAVEAVNWAENAGVEELTMWLLSTENVARPAAELAALYEIITDLVTRIVNSGVKVNIIGSSKTVPAETFETLTTLVNSANVTRNLKVNLAIGYGGRAEIVDAVKANILASSLDLDSPLAPDDLAAEVKRQIAAAISEESISEHLYAPGQCSPDLIIRSSGELRLSGFLLWQSQHSELYFSNTLWPDFTQAEFESALADFSQRSRRFGV